MELILLQRVEHLGLMGDQVSVKPGYARNYLLPQGMALRATRENRERFEQQRVQLEAVNLKKREEAQAIADRMAGLAVVIVRAASESGQLYGSVNSRDIADSVGEAGFTIERRQVVMDRPVKTLGIFDFRIVLHPEVNATVSVNIAQSLEEAEAQAERVARGEPALLSMAEQDAREAREQAERQQRELAEAAAAREQEENEGMELAED